MIRAASPTDRQTTLAERRGGRRQRLVTAAGAVYRRDGLGRATVRAVCREAGLTERYFYESFADPGALIAAAFDENIQELDTIVRQAMAAAPPQEGARLAAVLTAYYARLREDAAGARVFLSEIQGISPAIDAQFRAAVRGFGAAMAEVLPRLADAPPLFADGLAGGVIQIALAWVDGGYAQPLDDVVDAAGRLFASVRTPGT